MGEDEDIFKKETYKNKKKKKDGRKFSEDEIIENDSKLRKINESPIHTPNKIQDSQEVELAYSQESMFQDNSQSHEWFAQNTNQKDIKVIEGFDDDLEGLCVYCFKQYEEEKLEQHLLETCTVVVRCQFCRGAIYLR